MSADTDKPIIEALDVVAIYKSLGVRFDKEAPRESGFVSCYAAGREDNHPSASVNVNSGYYKDSGGDGESLSLWDFAVQYGDKFTDWKEARDHYAESVGIDPKLLIKHRKSRQRPISESLEIVEWNAGCERLAKQWCAKRKGITLDAVKRSGAVVAYWPCFKDKETKEKRRGRFRVIAFPFYGPSLDVDNPSGYVLVNITGRKLEIFRGKDRDPDQVDKMTLATSGAGFAGGESGLMNREAIARLSASDPPEGDSIEVVWKTEGPTDMLALMASIPAGLRGRHLVTCNTGGASQGGQIFKTAFRDRRVFVIHDADSPGEIGASKWFSDLSQEAKAASQVTRLPFGVEQKKGRDLRDWIHTSSCEESDT